MFKRIKSLISDKNQEQNTTIQTLEDKIKTLESALMKINKKLEMSTDDSYDKIITECHGNLWTLKNLIKSKTGEERTTYIQAYDKFCLNKSCWIGYDSTWGSVPTLPHGVCGIFVSGGAKIGKHCTIFQNVTIGSNTLKGSKSQGSPCIGDNVYIGAGAIIVGNCKIGNNVRIGAGCSVAMDIPDNSVVVSQKPLIIHKENMDNRFYQCRNGKRGYVEDGVFHPCED